jgi:hypothetical protein
MKILTSIWGGDKKINLLEIFKEAGIQNLLTQLEEK